MRPVALDLDLHGERHPYPLRRVLPERIAPGRGLRPYDSVSVRVSVRINRPNRITAG